MKFKRKFVSKKMVRRRYYPVKFSFKNNLEYQNYDFTMNSTLNSYNKFVINEKLSKSHLLNNYLYITMLLTDTFILKRKDIKLISNYSAHEYKSISLNFFLSKTNFVSNYKNFKFINTNQSLNLIKSSIKSNFILQYVPY